MDGIHKVLRPAWTKEESREKAVQVSRAESRNISNSFIDRLRQKKK
jgi:hypothetical protein